MGGDCGVTSEPGKGSTFWFTVLVHDAVRELASDDGATDEALGHVAVLIVDDNATHCSILADHLAGCRRVSTAASGQAALGTLRTAAIQMRPFTVVLVDRNLPGMDGLELRRAVTADPSLTARVVLMTDMAQERDLEQDAGTTISKPVHRGELRRHIVAASASIVAGGASPDMPPPAPRAVAAVTGVRLLLAEDNLINQKVAVAMLSQAGYTVDTVVNGSAAVDALASTRYDAVLMDCQMPVLNGYEATAAIRAREGASRHTPIIAMTAGARREDRKRCLAAGMDGYLSKPVSKDALLAIVRRSVGDRQTDSPKQLSEHGA
jgi:CheY-like chemotaxis protein